MGTSTRLFLLPEQPETAQRRRPQLRYGMTALQRYRPLALAGCTSACGQDLPLGLLSSNVGSKLKAAAEFFSAAAPADPDLPVKFLHSSRSTTMLDHVRGTLGDVGPAEAVTR